MSAAASLPPAVVLAGGRCSLEFAAEAGFAATCARARAKIAGIPMLRYVIRALRESTCVGRIVVVAPSDVAREPQADEHVLGEGGFVENIRSGLTRCRGSEYALLVTADIPFLTAAAVDDYVGRCRSTTADVCYAAVPRSICEKQFPCMRRTYLATPSEAYTGGNVVFQRIAAFEREAKILAEAHERRKNPLFLARLIGYKNLLRFAFRRLTLEHIERSASQLLGVQCRLVITPFAEIGADVDRPEDLRLARRLLGGR